MGIAIVSALFFSLLLSISGSQSSSNPQVKLHPLPSNMRSNLEPKLKHVLPPKAKLDLDPDQEFLLSGPGVGDLAVIPVAYNTKSDQLSSECGVFFARPNGRTYYVPSLASTPIHNADCTGFEALGTTSDLSPHPRLIVILDATAGHGPDYQLPFLLVWDARTQVYKLDRATTDWLTNQQGSDTVAGVRRLLAHHK